MKRIYLILFAAAALSVSMISCEQKTSAEKEQGHSHESDHVKDTTNVGDAIENEVEKTTKNGSDAH